MSKKNLHHRCMGFNRVSVPRSWTPKDFRTHKIIRKCEFWRANLKRVRKKEHKMGSRDMQIDWLSQSDRCAYQSKWSATRLLTCWKKLEVIGIKLFLKNPFFFIQNLYTVGRNYLYGHVLRFFAMVSLNFPPIMKSSPIEDCEDVVVIIFQIRKYVFRFLLLGLCPISVPDSIPIGKQIKLLKVQIV